MPASSHKRLAKLRAQSVTPRQSREKHINMQDLPNSNPLLHYVLTYALPQQRPSKEYFERNGGFAPPQYYPLSRDR